MLITYSFLKCLVVTWKTWIYFKYILTFLSYTGNFQIHMMHMYIYLSVVPLCQCYNLCDFVMACKIMRGREMTICSGRMFMLQFRWGTFVASFTFSSLLNMPVLLQQLEALCTITLEIVKYLLHQAIICNLKSILLFAFQKL